MSGETDLQALLADIRPHLDPERYVFVALERGVEAPADAKPLMTFSEAEGLTLLLRTDEAGRLGFQAGAAWRRIVLAVNSSLEAVGFLAALLPPLAAAGIAVNPVSAFHHDHLFVPADRAEEALAILDRLSQAPGR